MLTPGDATFHTTGLVSAKSRDEQAQHTAQIVVRPYDAEDVVAELLVIVRELEEKERKKSESDVR